MKFRYYFLVSIFIHLFILYISNISIKKDELIGEKLAPIEIYENQSFKVKGGNFKKNSKAIKENIISNIDKKKSIEKKNIMNKELNDKYEKIKEGNMDFYDKNLKKEIKTRQNNMGAKNFKVPVLSENKVMGISTGDNEGESEKGSVKGKGKLKVTCLKCILPTYPNRALRRGLEGKPLVKIWILKNGKVEKSSLIRSSGVSSIDEAALQAASESIFYPLNNNSSLKIEYDLKLK